MKIGKSHSPTHDDKAPNSGGIKVDPKYAAAIWMPIMAWECWRPKFAGVEWIIAG